MERGHGGEEERIARHLAQPLGVEGAQEGLGGGGGVALIVGIRHGQLVIPRADKAGTQPGRQVGDDMFLGETGEFELFLFVRGDTAGDSDAAFREGGAGERLDGVTDRREEERAR